MNIKNLFVVVLSCVLCLACTQENIPFAIDTDRMEVGSCGGVRTLNISADDRWVVVVDTTWVTVSPANGIGSTECRVSIDSSIVFRDRKANIRFQSIDDAKTFKDFQIVQTGFKRQISSSKQEVKIVDFAKYDDRVFEIDVDANVAFDVECPDAEWIELLSKPKFNFDRGARPRSVKLKFRWKVNTEGNPRDALVRFVPQVADGVNVEVTDLTVKQAAGPDIEGCENGIERDSLALIAISRSLGCLSEFEVSERMSNWTGITVWPSGDNKGRVKSATFAYFDTKESIPYAVKYLTEAEELVFFSNSNSFLKSIELGDEICSLHKLKKLTLFSYGLVKIPDGLKDMESLRFLDLTANNLQKIPDVLFECKSLTALFLTNNQRSSVTDLQNTNKKDFGGLYDECQLDPLTRQPKFSERILSWHQLDTLRLSVNFLQGELPSDKDLIENKGFSRWAATDPEIKDSLGTEGIKFFEDNIVAKVLPETDFLCLNLNRLHGNIPNWLKYHPKLDQWNPLLLVFPQEGKNINGKSAGFNEEPTNLNYYYKVYSEKKWSETNVVE